MGELEPKRRNGTGEFLVPEQPNLIKATSIIKVIHRLNQPPIDPAPPSGLFPQGKVRGAVVRPGLHPSKGGSTQGQPVVCPQCPAGLQTLRVAVLARCLCCRTSWLLSLCPGAVCGHVWLCLSQRARLLPGRFQRSFPRCPWSPEPGELLCAGSQLPAPRSARGNIPSRPRELSTPQIAPASLAPSRRAPVPAPACG